MDQINFRFPKLDLLSLLLIYPLGKLEGDLCLKLDLLSLISNGLTYGPN